MKDYKLISFLGAGYFGEVFLSKHQTTDEYFAIKTIKKAKCLTRRGHGALFCEKRILQLATSVRHPFLVNLYSCIQTETHVCFVMEYAPGGDLVTHMGTPFDEPTAMFYSACVVLGMQFLHENRIIYRDLKVDNLVIDKDGYVKITDFGLCKENIGFGDRTSTLCGTPRIIAPEILRDKIYTRAVDWWGLGIFLFEMIVGRNPFTKDGIKHLFCAIMEDEVQFPLSISMDALSIITRLLCKYPNQRLGSSEEDAHEVRKHSFYRGINWDDLLQRKIKSPGQPVLKCPEDVSNFDRKFTCQEPAPQTESKPLTEKQQLFFQDFDYTSPTI